MINKPRARPRARYRWRPADACPRAKTTIYVAPPRLDPGNRTRWYYWHRCLSAELGRFVSRDPIGYLGGFNLYEYVQSGPLRAVDPEGLWWTGYSIPCVDFGPNLNMSPVPLPADNILECPTGYGRWKTCEYVRETVTWHTIAEKEASIIGFYMGSGGIHRICSQVSLSSRGRLFEIRTSAIVNRLMCVIRIQVMPAALSLVRHFGRIATVGVRGGWSLRVTGMKAKGVQLTLGMSQTSSGS